ncbi:hypothetical protein [Streptomyces sp. NPDC059209]|uniref:hypothetical protein n=1 Tax=Streptomyces sp. NPDC059209 TaxID=3346769 RepID=UPI0036880EAC
MAQTKFDKQVEVAAESVAFGIGRFLAGRDLDGVKRTDATFWHPGNRVMPKVEGRVSRSSYRAGGHRLVFRITFAGAVTEGGYLLGRSPDTTLQTACGRTGTRSSPPWRPGVSARPLPRSWAVSRTGC